MSQLSNLMELFEIKNYEYLKSGTLLFHEIKKSLNRVTKLTFFEVIIL